MQNLVGIGIPDSADKSWISEGTFKGPVFKHERQAKTLKIDSKDLDTTRINRFKSLFAADDMK